MAAATAVFGIPELLGEILTFLSIEELIRTQRVSRNWRGCIIASPELIRTLSFETQPGMIVARTLPGNFTYGSSVVFARMKGMANQSLPVLRFAPPIKVRIDKKYWSDSERYDVFCISIDIRDLLSRPPGAWERMLLTQPVIKELRVELSTVAAINCSGEDLWESLHSKQVDLTNSDGIRIADLTASMRALVKDYEVDTGNRVSMTSFWDASFQLAEHAGK